MLRRSLRNVCDKESIEFPFVETHDISSFGSNSEAIVTQQQSPGYCEAFPAPAWLSSSAIPESCLWTNTQRSLVVVFGDSNLEYESGNAEALSALYKRFQVRLWWLVSDISPYMCSNIACVLDNFRTMRIPETSTGDRAR